MIVTIMIIAVLLASSIALNVALFVSRREWRGYGQDRDRWVNRNVVVVRDRNPGSSRNGVRR